ncbi:DinB family protein [Tepidiforma sp.]|uniref:DinB family protein n=1 Tax=Tepidiforma sp. TaxID=2682230 RepID=UPI002ADE310F|nr:DinB family protein [Tepidiforma sp.]
MTTPQSEAERIRSYLVAQAARLTIPQLVEKVRADCAPLADVARAIPADRFRERPAPGEWSAAEVWSHIIHMNESGADAIEAILAGQPPPSPIPDRLGPADPALADGAAAFERYRARREELLERVAAARGDEHLHLTIRHPMFGDLTWREWFLFMRVHDLDHLRQLQAIAAGLDGPAP